MEDFQIQNEDNGDNNPALDKVRKLLAKAEAEGTTEAERDALNAKANALIAKYGIDEAMAAAGRPSDDDLALKEYEIRGEYADEIARMIVKLGNVLGCRGILTPMGATVIAHLADISRLEVLYTSLSLQMHSGAAREVEGNSAHAVSVRRGWMTGFTDTVVTRVHEAEARAREDAGGTGSSTDLVLVSREVAVRKAFNEEFPQVTRSSARVNNTAYGAGAAAGRRADIGGKRVSHGSRAIAG